MRSMRIDDKQHCGKMAAITHTHSKKSILRMKLAPLVPVALTMLLLTMQLQLGTLVPRSFPDFWVEWADQEAQLVYKQYFNLPLTVLASQSKHSGIPLLTFVQTLLSSFICSSCFGSLGKTMHFHTRVLTFISLWFIFLLWWSHLLWRHTLQNEGSLAREDKEANLSLTFDTLLHIQQLRKKRLRSFCDKIANGTKLPPTQLEASQVLSSIMVNNKLHFLYCKIPATGVEGWEQLLEMLEEKGVTLQMPIPYRQEFGNQKTLSEYNLTSMEAMLTSYTKVIFIRDPFQRLISAYMHGMAEGRTFKEFIQYILHSGTRNAGNEWRPFVSLCQPCLVQYDYIIMFGSLGREVHHLMLRTGLPANTRLPEFMDSKTRRTKSWREEQMYRELTLTQKKQLCHFFRLDWAAFAFPPSLHWDSTCISGSN